MVYTPQLDTNDSKSKWLIFTGKCHIFMHFDAALVGLGIFHLYFVPKDIFAGYSISGWQFLFFFSLPFSKLAYKVMGLVTAQPLCFFTPLPVHRPICSASFLLVFSLAPNSLCFCFRVSCILLLSSFHPPPLSCFSFYHSSPF